MSVTIGVDIGLTVAIGGPNSHEFIKPTISIQGIEVDGDVDAQMQSAMQTVIQVWDGASQVMELKLGEALGSASDETTAGALSEQMKLIAKTLLAHDKKLKQAVKAAAATHTELKAKGLVE